MPGVSCSSATAPWQTPDSMNPKTFFAELKRRNVYKVAVVLNAVVAG